ncbi:MAG: hypothetical protein ACPK7O_04770 [Methanobacterium sp.]
MVRLSKEPAMLISVILGVALLLIFGITGIFSLIIIGFIAMYLTTPSERNYKVGGNAGIILGFIIFIYGFVSPTLPTDIPSISTFTWIGLQLSGIFNLILALVVSILICYLFGLIGGIIAQKILKKEIKESKTHVRNRKTPKSSKKSRRSLNRTYKN